MCCINVPPLCRSWQGSCCDRWQKDALRRCNMEDQLVFWRESVQVRGIVEGNPCRRIHVYFGCKMYMVKPFFFIYCFCLPIHFILFDPALPFCFLLSFRIVCLAAPSLVRVDSFVLYSLICILLAVDHVQILCTVYHIKGRKLILSAVLSTPLSLLGNCTTNVCLFNKIRWILCF